MKLLFDATFGEGWVDVLKSFFRLDKDRNVRVLHLYDLFDRDVKDDEWIPRLLGDEWLVLTADLGRSPGPRLPALCKEHRKTHVLFSPSMQKAKQFERARAIIYLWPSLIEAFEDEPGARYQLQADMTHQKFMLVKKA